MGVIPIAIACFRFVSSACVIDADAIGIRSKRLFSRQQVQWADVLMVSIGGSKLKIASATAELTIPLEYVTRAKGLTDFVTQHVDPLSLVNDGASSSIEEEQAQR